MATNSLHSSIHSLVIRQDNNHSPVPSPASLGFLRPTTTTTLSFSASPNNNAAAAVSQSSSASASASASSTAALSSLQRHLEAGDFREADEETRRLLIVLAGEAAQRRGYVFFSEVQYIPEADLRAIDQLWLDHSGGRFGYSLQKKIFFKANRDFTAFFIRVGWMKKLDSTEVDHYNYRSFPSEFTWDISDDTPEGHLPLTNALRGTQLLNSIFSHPAFDQVVPDDPPSTSAASSSAAKTPFKPNYTF